MKYKDTDGLQDPVLQRFATVDGLHVYKNHWLCISGNKNNEVSLYDSMSGNLTKTQSMLLRKCLSVNIKYNIRRKVMAMVYLHTLLSTHSLFRKSCNLNQLFHIF